MSAVITALAGFVAAVVGVVANVIRDRRHARNMSAELDQLIAQLEADGNLPLHVAEARGLTELWIAVRGRQKARRAAQLRHPSVRGRQHQIPAQGGGPR